MVVGGQPGAGKTQIANLVQAVLDRRGGTVRIGRDLYKTPHPHYVGLLARNVRTASGGCPAGHPPLAGRRRSPRPRPGFRRRGGVGAR
ncbi:zeta toxin family protein [Streptomyces sp. NBC_01483]|uniref:zeta toxin family protein n=1 Tax=Streptomyces sp. NBC_01483 TaxID=2903883 RepID=UPI002E349AB0|nr:zeta toxin family protein [Streptomyces sp. NBC_01483]